MQQIEELSSTSIVNIFGDLMPELVLLITIALLIIFNLSKSLNRFTFYVTLAGIGIHLSSWVLTYRVHTAITSVIDDVLSSGFTDIFSIIVAVATLLTILISGKNQRVEYYILSLSLLLGADVMMKSSGFIMILIAMELISISSYVLTAGTTADKHRAEAAWKFFIYGSVATAVMIFGMSYIYGATGELSLNNSHEVTPLTIVGGVMMLTGFLFKMSSAPAHVWAPDVYESTPAPIVALFSVVPKLAAFVVVAKLTSTDLWAVVIAAIALLTIIVGTLAALSQTNSKRMMAYSSVAQAGFLLIIPASTERPDVMIFYAIVFAIMNYVVFIVIHQQERSGKGTAFSDFNGIGYTNPWLAIAVTLGLISLAGIPPVAGFMAKLFVFTTVWTKYNDTGNGIFLVLFIIGLLATVASLFFYLKIPFYAFFRRSEENSPLKISLFTNLLLIILVGLLLVLFLAPGLLMS